MPTPSSIGDLSQVAASNFPAGSDSPALLDDVQRAQASFIAMLRDGKGFSVPVTLASAATTDIGAQNALAVEITGTTTITSFGTSYNGPRFLRFTGALILTHNATTLNLPGAANITTVAGDTAIAYPNTTGNGWNVAPLAGLTQVRGLSPTQTVLSGPVDSSGFSAFGGSVGTATLTTAATLKVAAAAGGDLSYVGSIVNAAFTSPGGSGTGYLCLSVTSAGVVTAAVRTLQRVEQWGGTYSITNGQLTFNIQEMTHKVGSGAAATQVYEVVIGECPYTAGVWSGTPVWYALNARASVAQTLASATIYSLSHNMGSSRAYLQAYMVVDDGTSSYPIPLYSMDNTDTGPVYAGVTGVGMTEKTIGFKTATTGLFANNVSVTVNFGTASAARINVKRWW